MDWKKQLIKEYKNPNFDITSFLEEHLDEIEGSCRDYKRKRLRRVLRNLQCFGDTENPIKNQNYDRIKTAIASGDTEESSDGTSQSSTSISYNNGQFISDRIISISEGALVTPEMIVEAHGLDPKIWEVISYKNNFYQTQAKEGKVLELYQSKLVVKPNVSNELTFENIDDFFEKKDFSKRLTNYPKICYNEADEFLEIDTADLHCGLLAWRNETGSDYDLQICSDKFLAGIDDIVNRAKYRHFSDIYFCGLGDILHIDNDKNETTKGTLQQADGRLTKIFDFAFDTINTAVNMLKPLNAKIHYIYLCGNHDRTTGYFLAKCLQLANPDIDFDIRPNPQKAIHVGKVLVGLTHGDMPKYNKGIWIIDDYRKEFGESYFVEEHCGHIHDEEAKKYNGIMVRSLLAQCGNSYWEHQQGYRSRRGIMCFVWNKEMGLRDTWYYYY